MSTVHRQQHSFSSHEWMFMRKCRSFCKIRGGGWGGGVGGWGWGGWGVGGGWVGGGGGGWGGWTTTPTFGFTPWMFNYLSFWGQTFSIPCFRVLALVAYIQQTKIASSWMRHDMKTLHCNMIYWVSFFKRLTTIITMSCHIMLDHGKSSLQYHWKTWIVFYILSNMNPHQKSL